MKESQKEKKIDVRKKSSTSNKSVKTKAEEKGKKVRKGAREELVGEGEREE